MKSINTKSIVSAAVLAIAVLGATQSFAASNGFRGTEGDVVNAPIVLSSKTRADVRVELLQSAKAAHAAPESEGVNAPANEFVSTRSRADVRMGGVSAAHSNALTGSL
jgi:hypothetical protein